MIVGITGAHCTGKSTLTRDLARWLDEREGTPPRVVDWIGARVAAVGLPLAEHCTVETYNKFLAVHLAALREEHENTSIIIDRTPFDLMAYALANGNAPPAFLEMLAEVLRLTVPRYAAVFYLPVEPGLPLQHSVHRSSDPAYRVAVDAHLCGVLDRFHVPAIGLAGSPAVRLDRAAEHLLPLLSPQLV